MKNKPNIVFITTDHQRADSLFARHQGIEVTPGLNRLAQDATTFARALLQRHSVCLPARL